MIRLVILFTLLLFGCEDDSYYNILGYEINEEPEVESLMDDSTFHDIGIEWQ